MHNSLLPITPTLLFSLTMAGVTTGFRQVPLTCPGHTRPVVHLHFSDLNSEGQFKFITASKGIITSELLIFSAFINFSTSYSFSVFVQNYLVLVLIL